VNKNVLIRHARKLRAMLQKRLGRVIVARGFHFGQLQGTFIAAWYIQSMRGLVVPDARVDVRGGFCSSWGGACFIAFLQFGAPNARQIHFGPDWGLYSVPNTASRFASQS